jgi:hypothetical protein
MSRVPSVEVGGGNCSVVATSQIDVGRTHIGFTKEADKLDLELVGVLTPPTAERRSSEQKESVPAE